jgi:hypothetical protein
MARSVLLILARYKEIQNSNANLKEKNVNILYLLLQEIKIRAHLVLYVFLFYLYVFILKTDYFFVLIKNVKCPPSVVRVFLTPE